MGRRIHLVHIATGVFKGGIEGAYVGIRGGGGGAFGDFLNSYA